MNNRLQCKHFPDLRDSKPKTSMQLLTGHLQAMLKDGEEVGVGICVAQLLLDQLKHGTGTLRVYVGLLKKKKKITTLEWI